ncbi:ABC transporter permease [Acuticoccus sp. MNP-M23]|uniref:ABC transporter permease n=1 Tax=Acuticoccus sp. MNP-M23 TaxID=3072793 RepID=UPI002815BA28|nr:ABC transporter permease [Acuticoccus sp. MNP-M23]WMS42213.1 ABC transporter permease [Acuticoccus sp. MNP-M23]
MSKGNLPRWVDLGLIPVLNLMMAFAVAGLMVMLIGENPIKALLVMIDGAFVYPGSLGYTLYYATNFIFSGLAVAVAFHAKLFNIGGEGQAMIGGLGAALVCLGLDAYLPGIAIIPIAIVAAAAFGAAWAFLPGFLQATRGSHVVITTIMFNFIAAGVIVTLLTGPLLREGQSTPQTRDFADSATLPKIHEIARALGFDMASSPLNISIILALIACVGVWVLIWRTPFGYRLRTFGESEPAARYSGVGVTSIIIITMCISGALAGLMSINDVLGAQEKLQINFTSGFGFTGIAVALMGRSHPVGIILASLLFGALYQGGAELSFEFRSIDRDMVLVIQGLIILFSGALAYMLEAPLSRVFGRRASLQGEAA